MTPISIIKRLRLSPAQYRLASVMATRFNQWLCRERLMPIVYDGTRRGGQRLESGSVYGLSAVVRSLKKKLADTPLTIEAKIGKGHTERRMVWRQARSKESIAA